MSQCPTKVVDKRTGETRLCKKSPLKGAKYCAVHKAVTSPTCRLPEWDECKRVSAPIPTPTSKRVPQKDPAVSPHGERKEEIKAAASPSLMSCTLYSQIMASRCEPVMTLAEYRASTNYDREVIAHVIRRASPACTGGHIWIATFPGTSKPSTWSVSPWQKMEWWPECLKAQRAFYIWVDIVVPAEGGHRNVVLVHPTTKTIEWFEPHGHQGRLIPLARTGLEDFFRTKPEFKDYALLEPLDFCPARGWQAVSGDAMCRNWSSLYTVLRFACPEVSRHDIVHHLVDSRDAQLSLTGMLQHWACFMFQYAEKHGILEANELQDRVEERLSVLEKEAGHKLAVFRERIAALRGALYVGDDIPPIMVRFKQLLAELEVEDAARVISYVYKNKGM